MIDSRLVHFFETAEPIGNEIESLIEYRITETIRELGGVIATLGSTGTEQRQAAYDAVILPHDEPRWARQYADKAFSCGLVAQAILRLAGLDHPLLMRPYRGHTDAVSSIEVIARHFGVWRPGKEQPPAVGDVWIIGTGMGTHVLTVLDVKPTPNGHIVTSVDGGQPEIGGVGCKMRVREVKNGIWRSADGQHDPEHPARDGRAGYGCLVTTAIPAHGWRNPRAVRRQL